MLIRDINHVKETDRRVVEKNWDSIRLILKNDDMGFSFNITTMYANTETVMHYKNHLESCFCLEGEATIEDVLNEEIHEIRPGIIYILNHNDKHIVRTKTDLKIACVFNPALVGNETHRADGSYDG